MSGGPDDAGDLDRSVILAMAVPAPHIFATTELLDHELLVAELADDLGDHPGSRQERGADGRGTVASDEQDAVEDQFAAGLAVASVDRDGVALADPELVTAVLEDCVRHPSNTPRGPVASHGSPGPNRWGLVDRRGRGASSPGMLPQRSEGVDCTGKRRPGE